MSGMAPAEGGTAKDLVCGMKVDPETAEVSVVGGTSYYFCCERCRKTFDRKPGLYIRTAGN